MKIFYKTLRYTALIFTLATLTSCDNDLAYETGKPTDSNCMNVYFNADNESNFVLDPLVLGDDYSVRLTVSREKADNTADIPIIVELADECFEIPKTIHFDSGQTETELSIAFPSIGLRDPKKFLIKIPDEYVDLYSKEINGTGRYSGSVLVSEWLKIVKNAIIYSYSSYQIDYTADIYWLAGANRFRFANFLESGIDLTFRLDGTVFDPNNTATWHGYITPLDNYEVRSYTSAGAMYWYLYDDANDMRANWTTATGAAQKGNICFYSRSADMDFNIYDGGIDGISYCHGWLYKRNSTSDWVYFDYDEVNLEGYDD